ncbi:tryptophan-rich sensory protein [candidate division FCPU426 bacterium]|nr:tryptophan-rich sensory protein [candidate division FCPU426 bacterium]
MNSFEGYQILAKPSWAPPGWLFGPVWTVLYVVILISFGIVFYKAGTRQLGLLVALPFLLNLIFNLAFTPLQFGLRSNLLASADILMVLGTLVWALVAVYPHLRWVTWANLPYLGWVLFATALQMTITGMNWGK